jgi:glycosyltransferase involved in cell wall biosynthesis
MISVIIPCYNYGHLIAETIESILIQTHTDIEIIVINDGSGDNTAEVVQRFNEKDKRVSCYSFPNTGLGASRNRGLEVAKGEFIQFLDADDLIEKRKFEVQLQLFREHPEADLIYGSVRYFTNDPFNPADRKITYWGSDKEWMPKLSGSGNNIITNALKGNFAHLSSLLIRKSLIDKVGLFDNSISAVADHHFLLRCVLNDGFFYYHDTPETYSLVRWHGINMSKNVLFMRSEEIRMRKMLIPLIQDPQAREINEVAIKGLSYQVNGSWKRIFLSNGPLSFLKKGIRAFGLEKWARKIFYKID